MMYMYMSLAIRPGCQVASSLRGNTRSFRSSKAHARSITTASAAAASFGECPDMNKRNTLNWLLVATACLPLGGMAEPFAAFFVPPRSSSVRGGQPATDRLGNAVMATAWKAGHLPGDYSLAQGLNGDPTYLVINKDGALESFGINAVCTHLGCVVPFNSNDNKFICNCHGSQYDPNGSVVRGPAPLPLALAHVDVNEEDVVILLSWTETDFRSGEAPWWK